jgi:lipopolysaccharide/colanic/teichoic acid biosynthesis glycosyltransferase
MAAGLHVQLWPGLSGIGSRRLRSVPISREASFYVEVPSSSPWHGVLKRAIDVVVSALVLLVCSPLLIVAGALVKLHDRGPILLRQERVGRDGHTFTLLKLRTMVPDAEFRLAELRSLNERTDGPLFKVRTDPRVTPIGRVLRATSFDEVPQLLNVLAGTMSLVGPRPALLDEVAAFDEESLRRLTVLPGITGLWQVEARDNPSFHAYRRLDLLYVDNWSIGLDCSILIATGPVVIERAIRALGEAFRRRGVERQVP